MRTLNQIISQITDIGTAHAQLASNGVGTIAELQAAPDRLYPLLWVDYQQTDTDTAYLTNSIRLIVADRVITGEEGEDNTGMEQEVLSDSLSILIDIISYFIQQHAEEYVVERVNSLVPFTEDWNDRVAGHSVVLQIRQFQDWNKCQVPESGASIPPSVDGLTLYDFCDQSVLDRLTAAQVTCLETAYGGACADANISINSTPFTTVASGGTYDQLIQNSATTAVGTGANPSVIPDSQLQINGANSETLAATVTHDQQVHDSAGADVGTAANPSVIADATVENNATPTWTDTVEAEGTLTLAQAKALDSDGATTLLADYIPSTSGFMFNCTPGAAAKSLAVSLDNATKAYGATVIITATPTGVTPTSYIFIAIDSGNNSWVIAEQAGNVYNYVIDKYIDRIVVVADATDDLADEAAITVTLPTNTGTFITNTSITDLDIINASAEFETDISSILAKMLMISPMFGGTAALHKFNLLNPVDTDAGFRLTFSGGWTHGADGAKPNGTNGYANTHFNPNTEMTSGDTGMSFYINSTNTGGPAPYVGGCFNGSSGVLLRTFGSFDSVGKGYCYGGLSFTGSIANSQGMYSVMTNGTLTKVYKDGAEVASGAFAGTIPNLVAYLGAYNSSGSPTSYSPQGISFFAMHEYLSSAEITTFHSAVLTAQENLSRAKTW